MKFRLLLDKNNEDSDEKHDSGNVFKRGNGYEVVSIQERNISWRYQKEKIIRRVLFATALLTILLLSMTIIIIVIYAFPVFSHLGSLLQIFTENNWLPDNMFDLGDFGALAFFYGTFAVGIPALFLAIFWGLGTAVFLSEYTSDRVARFFQPIIEFIAAVPSVVYGFLAFIVLSPLIKSFFESDIIRGFLSFFGINIKLVSITTILVAAITLSFMAAPIIASISLDAMKSTPPLQRHSAVAFGGTRWEVYKTVVYPHAKKSITASVLLAFGRVIGETIVVLIVVGNVPAITFNLLDPGITLTSAIALYFGEASDGTARKSVLFVLALALLLISVITVWFSSLIVGGNEKLYKIGRILARPFNYIKTYFSKFTQKFRKEIKLSKKQIYKQTIKRRRVNLIMSILLGLIFVVFLFIVFGLLSQVVLIGIGYIFKTDPLHSFITLLFSTPSRLNIEGGFHATGNASIGSILLVIFASLLAFPIATMTGIYLSEFAGKNKITSLIRQSIINISAIPSIVSGIFVYASFIVGLQIGAGVIPGAIALGILMVPIVATNTVEALRNVPDDHKINSQALGATKWESFWKQKFPYSVPSIITGYTLGIARIIGETAPILFTAATISNLKLFPTSLVDQKIAALPYDIFYNLFFSTNVIDGVRVGIEWAAATTIVLLLLILMLNFIAYGSRVIIRRKYAYAGKI